MGLGMPPYEGNLHRSRNGMNLSSLKSPTYIWLSIIVIPILLLVLAVIQREVSLDILMLDPLRAAEAPFFYGALSNIGIVVWCVAASVCLFIGLVVTRLEGFNEDAKYMLAAGVLSMVLMFDDLFMLHERVLPDRIGIPEPVVYLVYLLSVAWYLIRFRKALISTEPVILMSSLVLFAISMFSDIVLGKPETVLERIVEDGAKFLGIWLWTGFHLRAAWLVMGRQLRPTRRSGGHRPDSERRGGSHADGLVV